MKDRVCVVAVLIRAVDHRRDESAVVLLGSRAANREFYPDVWDVLGGHLEPGETSEQALVRELREEIGVTPTAWASLGEFRECLPGGNGSILVHLYTVTSRNGEPRNLPTEEHSEVSRFAVEDACRLTRAPPILPGDLAQGGSISALCQANDRFERAAGVVGAFFTALLPRKSGTRRSRT